MISGSRSRKDCIRESAGWQAFARHRRAPLKQKMIFSLANFPFSWAHWMSRPCSTLTRFLRSASEASWSGVGGPPPRVKLAADSSGLPAWATTAFRLSSGVAFIPISIAAKVFFANFFLASNLAEINNKWRWRSLLGDGRVESARDGWGPGERRPDHTFKTGGAAELA